MHFLTLSILLGCAVFCRAFPGMDSYLDVESKELNSGEHGQAAGQKSTNCSCGWTNKARIVGGKETLVNEFPLVVGLKMEGYDDIFCGGTIITKQHVITAAHCTVPMRGMKLIVAVGEHDQTTDDETDATQLIPVDKVIEHEQYDPKSFLNDISLLVLRREIKFTQTVGPACLPSKPTRLLNEYIKVLGWGKLGTNEWISSRLMKVDLRVIPLKHCADNFPTKKINLEEPKQICTYRNNKDSCQGDSGGPLIWLDPETNRYTLVALVSYGKRLCASKSPAVNTDVSAYIDWIQEKIATSKPGMRTCSRR